MKKNLKLYTGNSLILEHARNRLLQAPPIVGHLWIAPQLKATLIIIETA